MTNDTQQNNVNEQKFPPFGARLQSAREAQGLERRDAAAQLRLSEKVIVMMEKDRYAPDLPPMFIRGYLRAYSKLLQIPEDEVLKAIEPIQPKPVTEEIISPAAHPIETPVTSGNYYMRFFTIVIVLTMVGLVGTWWHSHNSTTTVAMTETQLQLPDTASSTMSTSTAPTMAATSNAAKKSDAAPQSNAPAQAANAANSETKLAEASPATKQVQAPEATPAKTAQATKANSAPAYAAAKQNQQDEEEYVDDNTEGNGN